MKTFNRNYNKTLKRDIKVLDILIFIILIALVILSLVGYNYFKQEAGRGIITYGYIGLFFLTIFFEFIPQLISPFFSLIVGIIVGLNADFVILLTILGSAIGSILGFLFGRKWGKSSLYAFLNSEKITKSINFWKKYGKFYVFLSAISPLPYWPIVFGAFDMNKREFILFGMIPRILGLLIVGYGVDFGFLSL
jgi:undecaprenyl-diphosphatase